MQSLVGATLAAVVTDLTLCLSRRLPDFRHESSCFTDLLHEIFAEEAEVAATDGHQMEADEVLYSWLDRDSFQQLICRDHWRQPIAKLVDVDVAISRMGGLYVRIQGQWEEGDDERTAMTTADLRAAVLGFIHNGPADAPFPRLA